MIKEVLDVMVGLAESGMTMLCVIHEIAFDKTVADRVFFLSTRTRSSRIMSPRSSSIIRRTSALSFS